MRLSKDQKKRFSNKARAMGAADEAAVLEGYEDAARSARKRGAAGSLLANVGTMWRMLCDSSYQIPWWVWGWIVFALLYFINPFDLIPDAIPVVGYLDDAAVVAWVASMIDSEITDYTRKRGGDSL